MTIEQFWNSSPLEITDYIESFKRRIRLKTKETVTELFMLATIINERHPLADKEKGVVQMPWDFYPGLFEEERKMIVKQKELDDMESYKERRRQYAVEVNRRRHT